MSQDQKPFWDVFQRLRAPWSKADAGERIAFGVMSLWLLCVGIAVWMAIEPPPVWVAYPAAAVLWTVGGWYFLVLGVPFLIMPFYAIWLAIHPKRCESEFDREFDGEWENLREERAKRADVLEEQGVLSEGLEAPLTDGAKSSRYPKPTLPSLPVRSAGAILIVALFLSGRPILASVYLFPIAGWLALDGLSRLWRLWRNR